jgi:hypothetical protein
MEVEISAGEELLSIAEALRRIPQPVESLRTQAATWLERLARNEKALAAVTSIGRGRKRDSIGPHLALDYLAQRELHGARRWKAAQLHVAEAWGVGQQTVKDAWTDWQTYATQKLDSLTNDRVGRVRRRNEAWTRSTLLADISADLRDQYGPKGRGK